jgi:dihydrofolate reductase
MISLIAAMAKHNVIGYEGQMPWRLPAELAHFKKITLGKTVLMGRRTFQSIGRPLPNRRNLVLTQQTGLRLPGCEIYNDWKAALAAVRPDEELMVMGGATLYEQALPFAQRLYLTFIDCDLPGDTWFPDWNPAEWRETRSFFHAADADNCFAFRCVQLDRASCSS